MIWYYNTAGCDLTTENLQWSTVMKNFKIQWKALIQWKIEDTPEVVMITKA